MFNILIVDDQPQFVESLKYLMEEMPGNLNIKVANNGQEGLKCLGAGIFQLVLLDLSLPDINGVMMLEIIKQRMKKIPKVLVLSGFSEEECGEQVIRAGADGYLMKTRIVKDLPMAICTVMNGGVYSRFSPVTSVSGMYT